MRFFMVAFVLLCAFSIVTTASNQLTAHPFEAEELDGMPEAKQVAPPQKSAEPLLSNVQQITFAGLRAGESYFAPDAQWMIFQSERDETNPFYQIYLMNINTGDVKRVSPGIGKTTCAWIYPKMRAQKVLFASTHEDPGAVKKQEEELARRRSNTPSRYSWDFDPFYDIYTSTYDGKQLTNLTNTKGYDAEGSWSPDGKLIAFASNRKGYDPDLPQADREIFEKDPSYMMDIYIMNSDGSNVRQLTTSKGYDGGPFFSPDGKRLTWRRFSEDGQTAEVFTMNIDGTDQKQITHLGKMSWAPYYHPSGDYLIFATNVFGHANFELFMVDVEGKSEPVRVTATDGFDGLPVFLPDTHHLKQHLAWTSTRSFNKSSQIFIAEWDDQLARKQLGLTAAEPDLEETSAVILAEDLKAHVSYLASDSLAGRFTGTAGENLATGYVASAFAYYGLEPAGKNHSFFNEFEFLAGVSLDEGNQFRSSGNEEDYAVGEAWRPLAFSSSGVFQNDSVVFGGYGLVVPKTDEFEAYNSYTHLDVTGKWVLVFRFIPENVSAAQRQHLTRYSELRRKAMEVRQLGAKGLIVVSGPNSQVKDELVPLQLDASSAGTSLLAVSVKDVVAEKLLAGSGHSLKSLQDQLDTGDLVAGFEISAKISGRVAIKQEIKKGRNVVARLRSHLKTNNNQAVLIGAHIDHLGTGPEGIFHGADDNASGVAGVLEIAQNLAANQQRLNLKRDIIFAAWSGEELGLLGSAAYVKGLETQLGEVYPHLVAALNMDMVGRLEKNLVMQGVGSSSAWPAYLEKLRAGTGLAIVAQNDPYLPTDATSFYLKGVPVLNAFTGGHEDYHKPSDTADLINYEGLEQIAKFMGQITAAVAAANTIPDYKKIEREGNGGTGFRAYLGTIPDYTNNNVVGVLLSGVKPGSPAEKAGILAGDIVVSLAGKSIENIDEYSYALAGLKIGEEVEIKVKRGGETLTMKVTPTSRS